jgi:glycosyltransferase involved in cell wall biosynthesis
VAEHVVLTGWLPREEALRRMADADVGVVTFPEHFVFRISSPTKTVEYMALGIPVVAGNNPDGEELVQQSGAGLTAPRDPDAFAAAVARILDDPALAREMGERGRTFIHEERDYRKQSAELAAMMRRLLRRGDDSAN